MTDIKYPGVEQQPSGSVSIWFRWKGPGDEKPKKYWETVATVTNARTLKQAAELRQQVVALIKAKDFGVERYLEYFPQTRKFDQADLTKRPANDPTFFEYAQTYLALIEVDKGTHNTYRKALNANWLHTLGFEEDGRPRRISEITESDILLVIKERNFSSSKTRNNALTPLRGMFRRAVRDGIIDQDPVAGISNLKVQEEGAPDPFAPNEVSAIIEHIDKHHDPIYSAYFRVAFGAGLRNPSELAALQWNLVDLEHRIIHVTQAINDNRELRKSTKTGRRRDVDIVGLALEGFNIAYEITRNHPSGFVFVCPTTDDYFKTGKAQRKVWDETIEAIGIRRRTMRQTRHTNATIRLMNGQELYYAARQMGHSIDVMQKKYSKWIKSEADKMQIDKLDQAFDLTEKSSSRPSKNRPKL